MRLGKYPAVIGSPEAFAELSPGVDQEEYATFLEQARLAARVVLGQDDSNIHIAERLVETGIKEDEALDMVIKSLDRQAAEVAEV